MRACEWPDEVWLGMERGRWPVQVFVSEDLATRWAADAHVERRIIGPVQLPAEPVEMRVNLIPARAELISAEATR